MQLDKKNLERLLRLDDDHLRSVLAKLLEGYGVDPARVPLQNLEMSALRAVLATAAEEDIGRFLAMFSGGAGQGSNEGRR